jgi:protein-L-isoaspartate(D-aspartate) O-methyltransferase
LNSNEELVDSLLRSGFLHSLKVIKTFKSVDRGFFVDPSIAYIDSALPFLSVTTSQPSVIALCVEKAEIKDKDNVLEIGSGSGYQTAILSKLASNGIVTSLEIKGEVFKNVKNKIERLGLKNVEFFLSDGKNGFKKNAPYDVIICSAAIKDIPKTWLDQLKNGGRLLAPVGVEKQWLVLIRKQGSFFSKERLLPVVFIPIQ